jgi:hypothetical protein
MNKRKEFNISSPDGWFTLGWSDVLIFNVIIPFLSEVSRCADKDEAEHQIVLFFPTVILFRNYTFNVTHPVHKFYLGGSMCTKQVVSKVGCTHPRLHRLCMWCSMGVQIENKPHRISAGTYISTMFLFLCIYIYVIYCKCIFNDWLPASCKRDYTTSFSKYMDVAHGVSIFQVP